MPNFTVEPEVAAEAAARTNLLDDVPIYGTRKRSGRRRPLVWKVIFYWEIVESEADQACNIFRLGL